jgi:hypothetical protein
VIKTVLAPVYLRLLITAEPADEATADQAARVALAAARRWRARRGLCAIRSAAGVMLGNLGRHATI